MNTNFQVLNSKCNVLYLFTFTFPNYPNHLVLTHLAKNQETDLCIRFQCSRFPRYDEIAVMKEQEKSLCEKLNFVKIYSG